VVQPKPQQESPSSLICFPDTRHTDEEMQMSVQQKRSHGHVSSLRDVSTHRSDPGAPPGTPTQPLKPPVTESQNHRIVGVGRDLCGSSSPTPLPKQGPLQ